MSLTLLRHGVASVVPWAGAVEPEAGAVSLFGSCVVIQSVSHIT